MSKAIYFFFKIKKEMLFSEKAENLGIACEYMPNVFVYKVLVYQISEAVTVKKGNVGQAVVLNVRALPR